MSRRAWRIDVGEDDPVTEGGLSRDSSPWPSRGAGEGSSDSDRQPVAEGSRLRRWWASAVRIRRVAWARCFGGGRVGFEESLHRFARELDGAERPGDIEAGLLRLTREMVPNRRITLVRMPTEVPDRTMCGSANNEAADRVGPRVHDRVKWRGESIAEVPLRCGGAFYGRLQVLTTIQGRSALRPDALRRLTIACTVAACALENLRQRSEWAWKGGDEASEDGRPRSNEVHPGGVIRDATFLNAVLPFALGQAKRHREPLSLLCLSIDRLGAIQDLLGPEAADCLVQEVCRVVASSIRDSDIVARLDDNRIVVLLIRARARSALHVAQMIGRSIAEKTRNVPELGCATASIGVAEFPGDCADRVLAPGRGRRCPRPRPAGGRNQVLLAEAHPIPIPTSPNAIPSALSCSERVQAIG